VQKYGLWRKEQKAVQKNNSDYRFLCSLKSIILFSNEHVRHMENLIFIALLIGFLSLDTTIAFQILLAQPLFACPIVGWAMGDPLTGFYIGMIMQMLWLSDLPMGAITPPEGNVASMIATVLMIHFDNAGMPNTLLTLMVFVVVVISYLGARLTIQDRRWNEFFLEKTLQAAERAGIREIALWNTIAIFIYFASMVVFTGVALFGLIAIIEWVLPHVPAFLEKRLMLVEPVVWGIGFGLSLRLVYRHVLKSRR